MADINWGSILRKAENCMKSSEKKKEIKAKIDAYMKNGTGSRKVSPNASAAADKFIEVLKNCINDCAGSNYSAGDLGGYGIDAVSNIKRGKVNALPDGTYSVPINFDGQRHRPSLQPSLYPEGIDDIVLLLNNGYPDDRHQMKSVSGEWHGKSIFSVPNREGAHFIEDAVKMFIKTEASAYNVIDIQVNL